MNIQVGDKVKFEHKSSKTIRNGIVSKIHANGRFSVKRDGGACLIFRVDWTHERFYILSVERPDEPKAITVTSSNDLLLKDVLHTLEFVGFIDTGVLYHASDNELANLPPTGEKLISIVLLYSGGVSFTFWDSTKEVEEVEKAFYPNPTAKDLYEFAGRHA